MTTMANVATGDIILAAHHNSIVDFLKGVAGTGEGMLLVYNAAGVLTLTPSTNPAASTELIIVNNAAGTRQFAITAGGDLVGTGGILTLPAGADTLVGLATTDTLTNKTLTAPTIADFTNAQHDHGDADDGGAVVAGAPAAHTDSAHTDTSRSFFVPLGNFASRDGSPLVSADDRYAGWAFDGAAIERIAGVVSLPADFASGNVTLTLYWTHQAAAADVVWRAYVNSKAVGESLVDTTGEVNTANAAATSGAADVLVETLLAPGTISPTAADHLTVMIERTGSDAGDTSTADAYLVALKLTYTATH